MKAYSKQQIQEAKTGICSDKWNRKYSWLAKQIDCIKSQSAGRSPNCLNTSSFRPTDKLTRSQTNCFHSNSTQICVPNIRPLSISTTCSVVNSNHFLPGPHLFPPWNSMIDTSLKNPESSLPYSSPLLKTLLRLPPGGGLLCSAASLIKPSFAWSTGFPVEEWCFFEGMESLVMNNVTYQA